MSPVDPTNESGLEGQFVSLPGMNLGPPQVMCSTTASHQHTLTRKVLIQPSSGQCWAGLKA